MKDWQPCCDECPGVALFNENFEVQRCDECGRFKSDAEAAEWVAEAIREKHAREKGK
jgi:hypothetical protein